MVVTSAKIGDRPGQNPANLKHVKHGRATQLQTRGWPRERLRYAALIPDGAGPARMEPDTVG